MNNDYVTKRAHCKVFFQLPENKRNMSFGVVPPTCQSLQTGCENHITALTCMVGMFNKAVGSSKTIVVATTVLQIL